MSGIQDITGNLLDVIQSSPELNSFMIFVLRIIELFGHTDEVGVPTTPHRIQIPDPEPGEDMPAYLRMAWNARADGWVAFEAPMNYALSMLMIHQLLRLDRRRPQRLLSTGQGAGIYEIYLAWLAEQNAMPTQFVCVDFSIGMSQVAQRVLAATRKHSNKPVQLDNIRFLCGDMNCLPVGSGTIDHVICNNALVWSTDWRAAVKEIARVLNPWGDGMVYLTFPMVAGGLVGNKNTITYRCATCTVPEILDELEGHGLSIETFSQYMGQPGTGQLGTIASRFLIQGKLRPNGRFTKWRENKVIAKVADHVMKLQGAAVKIE